MEMRHFFGKWRVSMRVSSAHYPQSNGQAEAAVRTAKRTLMGNTLPDGGLDNDKVAQAILQYRNTPLRGIDKCPAQLAMGCQLRDSVSMLKSYHFVTEHWSETLSARERERSVVEQRISSKYKEKAKDLSPIQIGERVAIKDVTTRAWNRSRVVIEKNSYRRYRIRLDGRISTRNRKHLRSLPPTPPEGEPTPTALGEAGPVPTQERSSTRARRPPQWHDDYITE
ncbi:uncharacterized protein [Palaemon carinicauda]|uniref:uncharacterized protein n=1 Tax=Palaemon carinicauda TaxID=392227 RepID=UPI0035B68DD3